MAYHVRIDHITQGPDGHEIKADRFNVNSEDFLRIYVEAELPSNMVPKGEYYEMINGIPGTKVELDEPKLVDDQYQFFVLHYLLSHKSEYIFRFADDLSNPKFKDQWEVITI